MTDKKRIDLDEYNKTSNIYVSKEALIDIMNWCNGPEQKPCCMCDKLMDCAVGKWDTRQPHGGGEIQLLFCFGSCKYDLEMGTTKFWALICDECSEKLVPKMIRDSNVELDENGRWVGGNWGEAQKKEINDRI